MSSPIGGGTINFSGQSMILASGFSAVTIVGPVVGASGQVVYLTSGQNTVYFSGQGVWISGSVSTSVSGNAVIFSGQGVWVSGTVATSVSGNAVNLSGQGVWVSGTVATSVSGNAVIFSGQGVWVSGTVTTSISGNAVNLSGQGVWVSGTLAVTTSVSGNVVDMKSGMVFNNVFDPSGNTWRATWNAGSGNHALTFAHYEPLSYFVRATNLQISSGCHELVMMPTSGDATVKIKAIHVFSAAENATTSGQTLKWDILRITNTSGGGTAISAVPTDPVMATSGVNLTLQSRATSGCAVNTTILSYVDNNINPQLAFVQSGQPSVQGHIKNILSQTINIVNPAGLIDFGDITLRSGWGLSVRQSTDAGYTQITSGTIDISVKYTIE